MLREAVNFWSNGQQQHRPDFIAQMGDLIDGQNAKLELLSVHWKQRHPLRECQCNVINLIGNHELYNRTVLLAQLATTHGAASTLRLSGNLTIFLTASLRCPDGESSRWTHTRSTGRLAQR